MVVEQCQDNMSGFIHNRNNVHPTWRVLLDITTADTIRLINYHYIVSEEKPSLHLPGWSFCANQIIYRSCR